MRSADEPVQPRPRKDPRDLRILDPACGSGHFLLYSFDLLLAIYEEAWSADGAAPRARRQGDSLREDYPDLADLRRAAPRLIVEHNLHGVDIDPRCAQIAALALWLRAQRAWKDLGVAASERPRIQRTHIVVAEPMPGDAALVDEFAARLDPPLLRDLFKKMVGESRLAGELGALLRVEDGIAAELRRAREQFVKQRQTTGFLPGMEPVVKQGVSGPVGHRRRPIFPRGRGPHRRGAARFRGDGNWRRERAPAALRGRCGPGHRADRSGADAVRRRVDESAVRAGSLAAKKEFERSYPRTKNDVYAAFVERGIELLQLRGLLGAITTEPVLPSRVSRNGERRSCCPRLLAPN